MGDPAGVGPELCLRAAASQEIAGICRPLIFGSPEILRRVAHATGLPCDFPTLTLAQISALPEGMAGAAVVEIDSPNLASIRPGTVNALCGEAAFRYVQAAIDSAMSGHVQAVTTGPLSKAALHAAGHAFPGHTEIFARRMDAQKSCMMQYSEQVTCTFVTVHVGYAEVPSLLTVRRIVDVMELTHAALVRIRGRIPKLLVCGLNPHAGEGGIFGDGEEEKVIAPAVELARRAGIDATGPVPADTAFTPARRREFDAVVCMYHDQGHIPVKMIAFDSAVNTTLGLPVVRTSVDHGTAFDIAWQGKADPGSLFAALRLAARLCVSAVQNA
jgi:4-hydroxythreonine-4-phosphate dehydrogenase